MSHSGRHHRSVLNVVVYGPVGMLVLSGISLGLATALSKITLEQLTPVDLFGVEVLVSAVPLVALAWIRGHAAAVPTRGSWFSASSSRASRTCSSTSASNEQPHPTRPSSWPWMPRSLWP